MRTRRLIFIFCVLSAVVAALLLRLQGYPAGHAFSALLVMVTISVWATDTLPAHIGAMMFMALAVLLPSAGPDVAFAGFSTSAFWLVFGGLVMGSAIVKCGLGSRLARRLVPNLPQGYGGLVALVTTVAVGLAFFVPAAMARVVILLPLVTLIAERIEFDDARRGIAGLQLCAIVATTLPAFTILTGNLPTILVFGAAERLFGVIPAYLEFLLAQFPPIGILQAVVIALIVAHLFGTRFTIRSQDGETTPITAVEKRVAAIVLGALLLWVTDWVHGVSPGWVALIAATACLFPAVGIFARDEFKGAIEFSAVFYTAGIVSLVSFVSVSGVGDILSDLAASTFRFDPQSSASTYAQIVAASGMIGVLATHPSVSATLVPIAATIADAAAIPLESVLLILTGAFPLVFIPYQVAPLAVGVAIAKVQVSQAIRVLTLTSLLTMIILLPAHYFWLKYVIGALP